MTLTFDRPIGSPADVAELEYIAALCQTDVHNIRDDGSITDEDIALFLTSRYGIHMTREQVSEYILTSFGHGGGVKADTCLDLVQIVSLLLIPKLRREQALAAETSAEEDTDTGAEPQNGSSKPLIPYVLDTMLHDVTGKTDPVRLTPDFLKELFMLYGESELANDEKLLRGMIDQVSEIDASVSNDLIHDTILEDEDDESQEVAAPCRTPRLNVSVFTRLLTDDIQLFDVANEQRSSTNFDDVFKMTHKDLGQKANVPLRPVYFDSHSKYGDLEAEDTEEQASPRNKKVRLKPPRYFSQGVIGTPRTEISDHEDIVVPISPAANCIDLAADTFRSAFLVIWLWTSFALSFFTYYWGWNWQENLMPKCGSFKFRVRLREQNDVFFCLLGRSIIRWFYIMVAMSIYGLIYFGLAGIGNSIENRDPLWPFVGILVASALTLLPPVFFDDLSDRMPTQFLKYVSIIFGSLVIIINFINFCDLIAPRCLRAKQWWKDFFTPQGVRAETSTKHAASHKVGKMVNNAREVHDKRRDDGVIDTYFGQALFNFSEAGNRTEEIEGFCWTWRNIFNRELFNHEGVWFSGRLLSINVTQFIVVIFVLLVGLVATVYVVDKYEANSKLADAFIDDIFARTADPAIVAAYSNDLINGLMDFTLSSEAGFYLEDCTMPMNAIRVAEACNSALQEALAVNNRNIFVNGCVQDDGERCTLYQYNVGSRSVPPGPADRRVQKLLLQEASLDAESFVGDAEEALKAAATQPIDDLYPQEKYMIFIPLLFGTIAAFVAAWSHAITILPSATVSVLKFRSGVMPFLRDPKARTMRIAPDQVAYLQGSAFWGILLSSLLFAALVGGLFFVFLWQITYQVAFYVLASFCGALLVILIHWLFVRTCRFNTSKAYYRYRPAQANIVLLARECAFFALTAGFVIIRAGKLIFSTILYLGRIDTPFLAPGVGEVEALGYRLDGMPYVFLMDILQHEAHRHPYIETLGVMYMMKLKHGEDFGSAIGSAWRLLFVLTLMPWLWKYRKLARPDLLLPEEFDEEGEGQGMVGGSTVVPDVLSLQPAVTTFSRRSSLAGFGGLMLGRQSTLAGRDAEADAELRWRLRLQHQKQESAEKEELLRLEVRHLQEQLDELQAARLAPQPPLRTLLAAERNQPMEFRGEAVLLASSRKKQGSIGLQNRPAARGKG